MNLAFLKMMNLLIVEDDNIAATFLSETLKDFFNITLSASNGHEALKILNNTKIHLLITDLNMPFFSGIDLIKTIRHNEERYFTHHLPILVVSGRNDASDFLEMIKYQLVDYIIKPFSLSELFSVLERLSQKMQTVNKQLHCIDIGLAYESSKKVLIKNKQEIPLTQKEALLLETLLKNKGRLVPRDVLIQEIYQDDVHDVTFRNLVMRLRKKLGKNYLINVKDLGMRIP